MSPAPLLRLQRSGNVYCVTIVWLLDSVVGNGIPRNDGVLDELRKRAYLVPIVIDICTGVPAGRVAGQPGEAGGHVTVMDTVMPSGLGALSPVHAKPPSNIIFPMYPAE